MNNLLLGGAGFIGQHLAHKLLKTRMERVTIIDNLATSRINLDDFAEYKNLFQFVEADLTKMDDAVLLAHMKDNHRIFHLAGSVGVEYIDKDPSGTLFNNIALSNKLIPLFKQARRPVIFASTSEIYGNGPFSENDNASIGPASKLRWGYATSKLMTEFMLRACDFPSTTVRFFNVVGPGQLGDYGMVLPRFINAAKAGEDLVVYGNGQQVRSFCHVNDAINALLKVAKIPGELFNIGNDEPVTILELASRVIELAGSRSKVELRLYEQDFSKEHGDINYRVPDLTKIRAAINYNPTYKLDDIIKDML
jgi:UDP-glucose 4-epimerase